jgi:hypothetical protein
VAEPASRIESARVESASYRDSGQQSSHQRGKEKRQRSSADPALPEIDLSPAERQEFAEPPLTQNDQDQPDHEPHALDTMA